MFAYEDFLSCSRSADSERRAIAARWAAETFVSSDNDPVQQAALYAALLGFLDDRSVKVRGAMAYGLLHAANAPRPLVLALLRDAPIIARAMAQFSPVPGDADLTGLATSGDAELRMAIAARAHLGARVLKALFATGEAAVRAALLARHDLTLPADLLLELAERHAEDADARGMLLSRTDLPAAARMQLVEAVTRALSGARIVKGAVAPARLTRMMRDLKDAAAAAVGEAATTEERMAYVAALAGRGQLNARLMLHMLINGQLALFSAALSNLTGTPLAKISALLGAGPSTGLTALFSRAGFAADVGRMMARLVALGRDHDLGDDLSARHLAVTMLIEDLLAEHRGEVPDALAELYHYLIDQNIVLARHAARGVLPAFLAAGLDEDAPLALVSEDRLLAAA